MELVPTDHKFEIPEAIAKCPYCNTKFYAQAHCWIEENDEWIAESIELECETEPDIDSDDWDDWYQNHSYMPYVYLLPVQNRVIGWINSNFRFNFDEP